MTNKINLIAPAHNIHKHTEELKAVQLVAVAETNLSAVIANFIVSNQFETKF